MLEVERTLTDPYGNCHWHVRNRPEIKGWGSQPLLDACRALKAAGVSITEEVGVFRTGSPQWDVKTTVELGAGIEVMGSELRRLNAEKRAKYKGPPQKPDKFLGLLSEKYQAHLRLKRSGQFHPKPRPVQPASPRGRRR